MKTDITMHSDDELSLIVMNDEGLYNERHRRNFINSTIREFFVFTDEQLEVLKQDLIDDLKESKG
jgi:hypothetical protein